MSITEQEDWAGSRVSPFRMREGTRLTHAYFNGLVDLIHEILERLARLEEKLDELLRLAKRVEGLEAKASKPKQSEPPKPTGGEVGPQGEAYVIGAATNGKRRTRN